MPEGPDPARDSRPPGGWDVARLTRGIRRGDAAALDHFYRAWFDRLYARARGLTRRDESFCLDVVQETVLRVIRGVRPMDTDAQLERWLARVVHTSALDLLRRESRRTARERRRAGEPGSVQSGADAAAQAERIAWLHASLARLPPAERTLLGFRFGRSRTLEASGAAAGVSGDTAHGQVRRAIARLRRAGEGHDERA